jgi:hypothetical protein
MEEEGEIIITINIKKKIDMEEEHKKFTILYGEVAQL